MPIAHDVTTYAESVTSATAASADFTIASTGDRYALIGFASSDGGGAAAHSSTDIEGTGATQIGAGATEFFGIVRGTMWGLVGPASGSARTLNATAADSEDEVTAGVSVYNGVDQSTPTRDNDITSGNGFGQTSIAPSHTLTTVSGDVCVMTVKIWLDTTSAITVSAGDWDFTRLNRTNGTTNLTTIIHLEKTATGTSTTIGATMTFGSANVGWIAESVALIPAAGGGGNTIAWVTA